MPSRESLSNRLFSEISVGDRETVRHRLTLRDLEMLAAVSGDLATPVDHGTVEAVGWATLLIGALLRTRLPGPGSEVLAQDIRSLAPARLGEDITVNVTARLKDATTGVITFDCLCAGPGGTALVEGTARVRPATERITQAREELPDFVIGERGVKFRAVIDKAKTLAPIPAAIVHPVEPNAIEGAVAAAEAGLIVPHFVGPRARIELAAREAGLDLGPYQLTSTEHSHAAADLAAGLAHDGTVHALVKGSLHTDEFLHPILDDRNQLKTGRRLSHVFLIDVPSYDRLLYVTDGAINIAPDLRAKVDIVQNAIDMARGLGLETPRVAILSATETVNPAIVSTLDAAALSKMGGRGQISGGIIDGPLAFDNAVSPAAVAIKHIVSDVAGRADIFVAPNLEAGNMIAKQLEYLASGEAAGVVLGARVPVILTSRADTAQSRLVSCAVACLLHDAAARGT